MDAGDPPNKVGADRVCIQVRPNRSLPPIAMLGIAALFAGLALTLGIGFSLAGAWLVLPFTGLEVVVVGAVFHWLYRHRDDSEWIVIGDDRVRVVQRVGERARRHEFQRYWTRVVLERSRRDRYPSCLHIGSHGRFVVIGAAMTEEARRALATELKQALSTASAPRS